VVGFAPPRLLFFCSCGTYDVCVSYVCAQRRRPPLPVLFITFPGKAAFFGRETWPRALAACGCVWLVAMLGWLPNAAAVAVPPSSGEGALQAGRVEQGSTSSCLDLTQSVDDKFRCNARRSVAILKLPRTGSTWLVHAPEHGQSDRLAVPLLGSCASLGPD
jgi:hypothetical protein